MDEGREGHAVQQLDVVVLVRPTGRLRIGLDFKHGPPASMKDQEVRYTLQVARVILENEAAGEHALELHDERFLVVPLQHASLLSHRKPQAYSIPSIKAHVLITDWYLLSVTGPAI